MYQKYLESIIAANTGEEFGEAKDIIARFDTLEAINRVNFYRIRFNIRN